MSHLLRKTKTEDELEMWLDKNMRGKKQLNVFFPAKPRHNLEQESPPASLVDFISVSVCLLSSFLVVSLFLTTMKVCL